MTPFQGRGGAGVKNSQGLSPELFGPGDTLTVQSALAGMAAGGIAAAELDVALLLEREEG